MSEVVYTIQDFVDSSTMGAIPCYADPARPGPFSLPIDRELWCLQNYYWAGKRSHTTIGDLRIVVWEIRIIPFVPVIN